MAVEHINYYYNTVSAALAAIVGWNFFVSVSGEDWNVGRFSLYLCANHDIHLDCCLFSGSLALSCRRSK